MKGPVIPVILIILIAAVVVAYLNYGPLPDSEDLIGGSVMVKETEVITGREISERALNFVEDNLKMEDGGYEYYIIYYDSGSELRSSEDSDNPFFGDVDDGSFLDGMAYLAYREIGDDASADAEFESLYAKCGPRKLCDGNVYTAVYKKWQDTGGEEYRESLASSTPRANVSGTDSPSIGFSIQSLWFSYLIKNDAKILNEIDDQLQTADIEIVSQDPASYEWFASNCQYVRAESSMFEVDDDPGYMGERILLLSESIVSSMGTGFDLDVFDLNIVVSCGHALVNLYELTGNETYKKSAESLLSVVANNHPDFKKFSGTIESDKNFSIADADEAVSNIHSTVSILDTVFFAARLADSEVVLK